MDKTDPRWNDDSRTTGSGNVFVDLGFDLAEAEVMKLRADVMIRMRQHLNRPNTTSKRPAPREAITMST